MITLGEVVNILYDDVIFFGDKKKAIQWGWVFYLFHGHKRNALVILEYTNWPVKEDILKYSEICLSVFSCDIKRRITHIALQYICIVFL